MTCSKTYSKMIDRNQLRIKFYLDKPNKSKSFIFLRYPCKDGYLRYSTKQSIEPSEFDAKFQSTSNRAVNMELDRIYNVIERYVLSAQLNDKKDIYQLDLTRELNDKLGRQERVKTSHFFDSLDKIIDLCKEGDIVVPKKGTRYTAGSIKNFVKARNHLFTFDPLLDFSTITLETYYSFIKYCNSNSFTVNYTGSLIKEWKTLMGMAFNKGYHHNLIYNHPLFKKVEEESFQVYLNDDEILKLYKHNLSASPFHEVIRDRFVINLFNGLRISDHKNLTEDQISNGIIIDINQKTNKRVVIPVHPLVDEIIKKYGGKLPRQYHQEVVNREIKEIAKAAGLVERQHFTKTVGGVVRKFTKEKWQMISNHTCRRSLTTNLLKHASTTDVQHVVGMSLKTLERYNKRTPDENAEMLKTNPFFLKK